MKFKLSINTKNLFFPAFTSIAYHAASLLKLDGFIDLQIMVCVCKSVAFVVTIAAIVDCLEIEQEEW